ncbi:MAG: alpha-mannosidase [Bacillota bacterium]|nr:MAG: alpha-mannosidase [Bacillota bacterium]
MHYQERLVKYISLLREHTVKQAIPVSGVKYLPCDYKKTGEKLPDTKDFVPFSKEDFWGGKWDSHAWFSFSVTLPKKAGVYRLKINTNLGGWDAVNPQLMAYVNGKLKQGLDTNHTHLYVTEDCDVMLYAYSGQKIDARLSLFVVLEEVCEKTEKLAFDIEVPFISLSYTDKESKEYADATRLLNKAIDMVDFREPHSAAYEKSVEAASEFLKTEYYEKLGGHSPVTVRMLGHTHIDIAWQWTLLQTREKVQRSFATVLMLMDRYPEFKFFSSQPVLYQMFKEECPELYEVLKRRVKEGRWEVDGAMWTEADCNLSSGESLVRQIVVGKKFFKEEFGAENRILWLPDVFGYSAALPQILKKSGVDYFVTTKITWNDTNRMPYDAFRWEGLDGTDILTYFITTQEKTEDPTVNYCTYVGFAEPKMVAGTLARFTQKGMTDEVLMPYGWGDGGGGPSREFIENIRRMNYGIPTCPKTEVGEALEFLQRFEEKANADEHFPRWSGELYLEYHRGTYTSAANNKKNNRRSEYMLANAEWLSVLGGVLKNADYPKAELDKNWEIVLHNQFHDILPGSSIKEVYEQCDIEYAEVKTAVGAIVENALKNIASDVKTEGGYVVFNPHSFENSGYVQTKDCVFYAENVPAKGYKVVVPAAAGNAPSYRGKTLSNDYYDITFDDTYHIVSLFDKKAAREALKSPAGLVAYEDYPYDYDAWELSDYYRNKPWKVDDVQSAETISEAERCGVKVTYKFGKSTIRQTTWVYARSPRIDMDFDVDWQEEHIMLKTEFPVDVRSDYATYDVQFGAARRTAHNNTSWDTAMFEVCAHKFADFSEYGYGVSLMSDCKYGYSVKEGVMTLSLLKCATFPNPDSDKGRHTFRCSLMPHAGDYRAAGVVQQAYDLNAPMFAVKAEKQNGALPQSYSLVNVAGDGVIMETVKRAEESGDIVCRAYESYGRRTGAKISLGFAAKRVTLCNLLEKEEREIELSGNAFTADFKPFEILTFKIER